VAAVDDSQVVSLGGSVHPFAVPRNDAGPVPVSLPMSELELVLRRSPVQESMLTKLIADQRDRSSSRYHHWLTPAEFGVEFGANDRDLQLAARWLQAHGFGVGNVPAGRGRVPFSGTAAQVESTFHTAIHFFDVDGKRHFANVTKPEIPAALAPLVVGIRGLHDFHPQPLLQRSAATGSRPNYVIGGIDLVGPADFATIYNLTPLYANQILGTGVSIAIASQSDIDKTTPPAYWSAFGVTVAHPVSYLTPNGDPGITGAEIESDLDVEIAGSLAPNAQVILVSSTDALTSAAYAINNNLAAILSVSYGSCEAQLGTAGNAATNSDFQQAVAQGITVVVASGDQGSAGCDINATASVYGLAVNGLASTPYDVALGGTDFNPTLVAQGNYWNSTNSPGTLETALSYIPEMVWNFSCTNPVYIAEISPGDLNPIDFCNNPSFASYVTVSGGSGGLSSASLPSGGSYVGYAQPAWQAGVAGIQAFGARALPDLSLQATSWAICTGAGSSCKPASGGISEIGGTSAAAPAFAAIMALLDQTQISAGNPDGRQGLINPLLYQLATSEYGSAANPNNANLSACNSNQGASVGVGCVFHDITVGNNSVPCDVANYVGEPAGTSPTAVCATSGGDTYGVLELNSAPAFISTAGYDLATGLGTLNAANLVSAAAAPSGLTATLKSGTATLNWNADPSAPQGSTYNVYEGTAPSAEGATPIQTGLTKTTTTVTGLATVGQAYYFRVAAVSGGNVSYESNEAAVANPPAAATGVMTVANGTGFTVSWNASFGASSYSIYFGTSPGGESATPDPSGITSTSQSFSSQGAATYYLKVVAVNLGGSSPASAEISVTVAAAAPMGLYATPSTNAVTLDWLPSYGALSYSVYEGTTPGGESATPVQTGIAGTSAIVTGLSPGQNYYFTVKATSAGGASAASGEAATQTAPAAPTPTSNSAFFGNIATDDGNLTPASLQSTTLQSPVPNGTAAPSVALSRSALYLEAAPNSAPSSVQSASSSSQTNTSTVPENGGSGAIGVPEIVGCGILIVMGRFRARRAA
jgi:hypothetical protein